MINENIFLSILIIVFLNNAGPHRDADGFVATTRIVQEMQSHQFLPMQVRSQIERLASKKLIEAVGRATTFQMAEDVAGEKSLPDGYGVTSVCAYHLVGWLPTFAYMDAMSFDTPIFSDETWNVLASVSNSFDTKDRLRRTEEFARYLSAQWHASELNPVYFDWSSVERSMQASFAAVKGAVERRGRLGPKSGRVYHRARPKR
jgi:hypothetical protein